MKQKILFIINSLSGGGGEKSSITALCNIDYSIFEVHLCVITKYGLYIKDIPREVRVIYLYEDQTSLYTKLSFNMYSRLRISLLERLQIRCKVDRHYDTIVSFMEGRSLKFHSYVANRANNNVTWVRYDIFNDHYTIGDTMSERDEKRSYDMMSTIVFVSNDAKAQFNKLYKYNNNQVVIYNPIDRELIRREAVATELFIDKKGKIVIGSVGGLRDAKAFDRVIKVAAKLRDDRYANIEFWIVGEGELYHNLESEIRRLDLGDFVKLLGAKYPSYPYCAKFDIFLLTSKYEGFSRVVAEAFCLGVPVVATRCTGPVELLDDGKYGVLVDQDEDAIYRGVKSLLDDKSLLDHYRMKSIERSKIFNIKKTMEEIYSIL